MCLKKFENPEIPVRQVNKIYLTNKFTHIFCLFAQQGDLEKNLLVDKIFFFHHLKSDKEQKPACVFHAYFQIHRIFFSLQSFDF